jgi:D-alanyl-D-alanine-carboxypeptidase/D-alanyl-D-alanine-endopeptidase
MNTTAGSRQQGASFWLLASVAGLLLANGACASGARPVDAVAASAAAAFMAAPQSVGLSVGILHAGKAHSYHFGSVSKELRQLPDDRSIYPIASLTKTFAGMLLAQAELEKKLKLDDDVRRHLDGPYANLAFEQQPVRLYHLLNHRSGLPFVLPNKPEASPGFGNDAVPFPQRIDAIVAGASRAEFYAGLRQVELTAAPGTRFQYSNAAAQLLGFILEGVYRADFETLIRQKIATPLGMRDTAITLSAPQQKRLVAGYDETGARQPYGTDRFQAAGALKSTMSDMLAYARWQLDEGDPAVRLSHQASFVDGDYAAGLNWQMLRAGARRVIWQDGAIPGFASLFVIYPESGLALVIMSNELGRDTLGRLRALSNSIAMALDADSPKVP